MVAAGGNFMRKTPQEAYDLIENMTHHHFQWDAELYYNTTTNMSAHYSETTFTLRERVEVLDKSSGSTPSHSNQFLPEYESFCFEVDHIEEKSSGSNTSHSDLSLLEYESFHFDLSIDQLPPNELAHIISPPEYDHFYFDLEDIRSVDPPESTLVIDESTLLVTTLPDSKEISLMEVERFDSFFSLTQSGRKTWVMENPSFGFHHMPSYSYLLATYPSELM
ncbi:hypothetical protein Tco_1284366 [Tanacetum coccineum]